MHSNEGFVTGVTATQGWPKPSGSLHNPQLNGGEGVLGVEKSRISKQYLVGERLS